MNVDIRLKVGFFQNPKVRKLRMRYGADAVLALQELWLFAAEHRPSGIMHGMDADDMRLACGAHTDGILEALIELKFVTLTDGIYRIHQWEDHQPWACTAEKRRANAVNAARSKWEKIRALGATSNAGSSAECNADGNAPNLTIPEDNKKRSRFAPPSLDDVIAYCQERNNGVNANKWMAHYESNGWMVGKNKMKDWKAAVRKWEGDVPQSSVKVVAYDPQIHGWA